MAIQTSLFGEIPESPVGLTMGDRQRNLLRKIPRYSTGCAKNERLEEIQKQLQNFSYSDQDLDLMDKEISLYAKHYGHEAEYPLGSRSKRWQ